MVDSRDCRLKKEIALNPHYQHKKISYHNNSWKYLEYLKLNPGGDNNSRRLCSDC